MSINLALDEMSVEEKIQAMEKIWADLCERAQSLESPGWHADVLGDREAALKLGEDQFTDWDIAKESIKKRV